MSRTLRAAVFMRVTRWLVGQWVVLCVRKCTSLFWALRAVHLRDGYMVREITFSTLLQNKGRKHLLARLITIKRHKKFYSTKTIRSILNNNGERRWVELRWFVKNVFLFYCKEPDSWLLYRLFSSVSRKV